MHKNLRFDTHECATTATYMEDIRLVVVDMG